MELHGFPGGGCAGETAGYAPVKMKRRDLEDVSDEFSEFSLSSLARKIRRLDVELPPIMEEEEPGIPLVFGQPLPEDQLPSSLQQLTREIAHGEPSRTSNKERAIVLYKPVNMPLLDSPCPPNVFLNVDPDMISDFKSRAFWRDPPNLVSTRDKEAEASTRNRQGAFSSCLAVVPWMPPQLPEVGNADNVSEAKNRLVEDTMASEDSDGALMDIEVEGGPAEAATTGMPASEGLQQHWQQHCMTPQAGPSESTAVMWSWG